MVAEALAAIQARMKAACDGCGRHLEEIMLIAVSKGHPVAAIEAAYAAGHRDFGENRAQELAEKAPQLPDDIRWHFVGSLQRRKAKLVRPFVTLLHSLDRRSLVEEWSRGVTPAPPVLIQVNVGREGQKGGVMPEGTRGLVEAALDHGLKPVGLMVIPPVPVDGDDSRRWFDELSAIRDELRTDYSTLSELSMGMTDDFEVAIEAGSTMIRVGRAIFGPRPAG